MIGQHLANRYELIHEIGHGGMGVVYAARDPLLEREVAIKMIPPLRMSPKAERRFQREAQLVAQMDHPAIVPIFDFGHHEGSFFLVMQLVEGETLRQLLHKGELRLDETLEIVRQVAEGLAYSHSQGVIHRDIKPENIIVGMFGEVTLIDWGAAKVWGMPNDGDEDTKGQRGGTPLYMSPEQVVGNRLIDERSDVFSLGVVMYEMLCQREPFRGRDITATFDNIVHRAPQRPREVAPNRFIPAILEQICLKAMSKDPNSRYQSMREFMNAINKYRADALMRGSV